MNEPYDSGGSAKRGDRLPHEVAIALLKEAKLGSASAQETLVRHNAALVKSIVKRYMNRGVEYDDLYQIGCMGLVKAIRNFDTSYNVRFSTYAVPMIAGEIKRFLRDDGMVKVSRTLKELAARASAAREQLLFSDMREPGVLQIAEAIGESPEDVALALESSRPHMSIYEPAYGDDSDSLVVDRLSAHEDETGAAVNRVLLKELLSSLDARERQVIMLRYFQDKTQSEIAAQLCVSQVQVSRLESRILAKLRELAT